MNALLSHAATFCAGRIMVRRRDRKSRIDLALQAGLRVEYLLDDHLDVDLALQRLERRGRVLPRIGRQGIRAARRSGELRTASVKEETYRSEQLSARLWALSGTLGLRAWGFSSNVAVETYWLGRPTASSVVRRMPGTQITESGAGGVAAN